MVLEDLYGDVWRRSSVDPFASGEQGDLPMNKVTPGVSFKHTFVLGG